MSNAKRTAEQSKLGSREGQSIEGDLDESRPIQPVPKSVGTKSRRHIIVPSVHAVKTDSAPSESREPPAADAAAVAAPVDQISGREAAEEVHLAWPGSFNRVRRRMQIAKYIPGGEKIWTVPLWGGLKLPGCDWTYSRAECRRFVVAFGGGTKEVAS